METRNNLKTYMTLETIEVEGVIDSTGQILTRMLPNQLTEVISSSSKIVKFVGQTYVKY